MSANRSNAFVRTNLNLFLPSSEKFVLKKEQQKSLLWHNKDPNGKILAIRILSLFYQYQVELCFKNDEYRKQFEVNCPSNIRVDNSQCNKDFILNASELTQDLNSIATNYIYTFDRKSLLARRKNFVEALSYINAFESLDMNLIKKIDDKIFKLDRPILLKSIKDRLTNAYNKGLARGFFQKIKLHADVGLIAAKYISEETFKNFPLVAKDIALSGTKMHNEEAEKILSYSVKKI